MKLYTVFLNSRYPDKKSNKSWDAILVFFKKQTENCDITFDKVKKHVMEHVLEN